MNFKSMSFKTKLILVISIINIIVVSLTLWIRAKQIEKGFKERMIVRSKAIVDIIDYSIDEETKLDREVIGRYAQSIIQEPEIEYIVFFNKQDKIISAAGNYNQAGFNFKTDNIYDMQSNDKIFDVYKKIVGQKGEKIGAVIVGFPLKSLKNTIRQNVITGIIIWMGAIILMLVFNYGSITIFLKPVKLLHEAAMNISKKDFGYKIPVNSGDELGQISKQFNTMTEQLESFYYELEKKVTEATTGLQKANKRLKEIDERKSEFVAIVAHDLRTPVTSIMGFADTLVNKELKLTEQDRGEYLNIIREETRRLARLIADFLDISKIEDNRLNLDITKTDIKKLINKSLNSVVANSKGVTLSLESEENLREIYLDADRIMQVLQNLIGNALKYSPRNSAIKVLLKQNSSETRISIIDQGPGISDRDKERVFEKFYRGDDDISRKERGTGLGLAIAKSIVEMHGGRIWIEDAVPCGSCFIFTLPIKN